MLAKSLSFSNSSLNLPRCLARQPDTNSLSFTSHCDNLFCLRFQLHPLTVMLTIKKHRLRKRMLHRVSHNENFVVIFFVHPMSYPPVDTTLMYTRERFFTMTLFFQTIGRLPPIVLVYPRQRDSTMNLQY